MKNITNKKKRLGRPRKNVNERQRFGVTCTEAERARVYADLNRERVKTGQNLTISDYFLRAAGIRQ